MRNIASRILLLTLVICGVNQIRSLQTTHQWGNQMGNGPLSKRFAWKVLDFEFLNATLREEAKSSGQYVPENGLPVGIEIYKDKLFITVPRWREGIPATLNYIPLDSKETSPKLIPYPSLEMNKAGDCGSGLTTAYRIHADTCDRLWVLDTGTIGYGDDAEQACPYKLKIYDLKTDKILRQYELNEDDTNENTFIANIAVDMGPGGCEDTFAYMSDELGYGLIAYSFKENRSWRFTHSYFMPDPLAGDYNIDGLNFQWGPEGIFGMSLSPLKPDGFRTLFFHPLSSNREFAVSTKTLRNEDAVDDCYHDFEALPDRGMNSRSTSEIMDENGLQFFTLIDQNAVGCWNSLLPYAPANLGVVAKNDEEMIFPVDIKARGDLLYIMSDRMPKFLESAEGLNYTNINFRIFTVPLKDAVAGTVCDSSAWMPYSGFSCGEPEKA